MVEVDGENTVVAIVCTSGSTGLPKGIFIFRNDRFVSHLKGMFTFTGVCLSHATLLQQAIDIDFMEGDTLLFFSTIYWISGLLLTISSAIKGYCRVITTKSFCPELTLHIIQEHRVRATFAFLLLVHNYS